MAAPPKGSDRKSLSRDSLHVPCNKVRLEVARFVLAEGAADDLLHLAVMQVDARAEKRSTARVRVLCHDVRVVEANSKKERVRK